MLLVLIVLAHALGIEHAREYILVQFYIVKDDGIGRELQARLIARAREGIRVFFLYDEVGSYRLPGRYTRELAEAGVEVSAFRSTLGRGNRFQVNFSSGNGGRSPSPTSGPVRCCPSRERRLGWYSFSFCRHDRTSGEKPREALDR